LRGRIDVLIANVPYVATRHLPLLPAEARLHEPRTALDGGGDGLDVFRAVLTQAPAWLAPGGVLLSEITAAQQDTATAAVRAAGLEATVTEDEDLDARVVRGRRALR
jgi:release factor glutamine methyltransferase